MNVNNIVYFTSFGVKHIPKENQKIIENKNIRTNIYRIQTCNSTMYWFYWFWAKGKSLVDYTDLFSSNDYEKNDKIILK